MYLLHYSDWGQFFCGHISTSPNLSEARGDMSAVQSAAGPQRGGGGLSSGGGVLSEGVGCHQRVDCHQRVGCH